MIEMDGQLVRGELVSSDLSGGDVMVFYNALGVVTSGTATQIFYLLSLNIVVAAAMEVTVWSNLSQINQAGFLAAGGTFAAKGGNNWNWPLIGAVGGFNCGPGALTNGIAVVTSAAGKVHVTATGFLKKA